MKKCLVLGGSRGIGHGAAKSLGELGYAVEALSSKQADTSDLDSMREIVDRQHTYDVLVLNTGGPPPANFEEITRSDCEKYHNQLFYGFFYLLQNLKLNDGAYIFLISSFNVKEPNPKLLLSNAYRLAFISVFKCLSKVFAQRNITMINIAPGPIDTDRLRQLCPDYGVLESEIPLGRVGTIKEIGDFMRAIVENNIKYLTGVTINFDGGKSNYVL
jgi:3-oxoacyl-[acyl-carrier protein] reductase